MLKKIFLCITIPFTVIAGSTGTIIGALKITNPKEYRTNNDYKDRTHEIIEDIKNTNYMEKIFKNELEVMDEQKKSLHILGIFADNHVIKRKEKYYSNHNIDVDLDTKTISTEISFDEVTFTWHDLMYNMFGDFVKTKDYTFKIQPKSKLFSSNLEILEKNKIVDVYKYKFKDDKYEFYNSLKWTKLFYTFYQIYIKSDIYYRYNISDEFNYIIKCNINNIFKKFTEIKSLPNSNITYNMQQIKSMKLIRFNKDFSTLFELNKIEKIYSEITNKKDLSENEKLFIDELEQYKFSSYEDVYNRYLFLKETGELKKCSEFVSFNSRIEKLISNLQLDVNYEFNYKFWNFLYELIKNYFISNEITLNCLLNGKNIEINIWKNKNFVNIFEQLPNELQENRNIQELYVKNFINKIDKNNFFIYDQNNLEINETFKINYRWNAKNRNILFNEINTNGIVLNTNKLLSEIIYEDKIKNSSSILNILNKTITNEHFFDNIELISEQNWKQISKYIDINKFNDFFKLRSSKNEFNFNIDDSKGIMYCIVEVKNISYTDGTSGDFLEWTNLKLLENLNKKHNNIFYIDSYNNSNFYVIKLITNKIHINV